MVGSGSVAKNGNMWRVRSAGMTPERGRAASIQLPEAAALSP